MEGKVVRVSDTYVPGVGQGCLVIECSEDGDVFVQVSGIRPDLHPHDNQAQCARIEFCMPQGGGWHLRTIQKLRELAEAIKADNEDPDCPPRYKEFVHERG